MVRRILSSLTLLAALIGCTNPLSTPEPVVINDPVDSISDTIPVVVVVVDTPIVVDTPVVVVDTPTVPTLTAADFYVSGILTDNSGKPIAGAVARLMKSGLSAITDANGIYKITGTSRLAKRSSSGNGLISNVNDTLVIKVGNPNARGDSSEVIKTAVSSGIIMELPTTYIVQREIRGYLADEDLVLISKITAYVYDKSVPDQVKEINLWHDAVNDAFSSFAYFSSESNKSYTLYVKIYDNQGNFIGQSPDYEFTDNTGNIIFKNPFKAVNAKPTISISVPSNIVENTKATVTISAVDSFGGKISKCEVAVGNKNFSDISSYKLAKRMSSSGISEVIEITPTTTSMIYVKATDDENNVTIDSNQVAVRKPKFTGSGYFANITGTDIPVLGDSVYIGYEHFTCDVKELIVAKIEVGSLSNLTTVSSVDPNTVGFKTVADTTGFKCNNQGNGIVTIDYYFKVTMDNGSSYQVKMPLMINIAQTITVTTKK